MNTVKMATGQTIFPGLRYADARAAITWLQRAFDAETHVVYDHSDGTISHAELIIAGNLIMLGNTRDDDPVNPVRSPQQVHAVTAGIYGRPARRRRRRRSVRPRSRSRRDHQTTPVRYRLRVARLPSKRSRRPPLDLWNV